MLNTSHLYIKLTNVNILQDNAITDLNHPIVHIEVVNSDLLSTHR